jgi:DNA-binding GntR family transcriptional regulator
MSVNAKDVDNHARNRPSPPPSEGASDLSGSIYQQLSEAILSGEIRPGEKLSEPVLAQKLGASRAPIREAIRRLQERGLVIHVANHGARVVSPSLADYLALLDVREALEGMSARLAATEMSDDEVRDLQALVRQHGEALHRDPSAGYIQGDPDTDFHVRVARGSRNPVLAGLLCDQFYPLLQLCRRRHRTVAGRGLMAWKEHRRVIDAIADRDPELAELLMRRHVKAAKEALLSAFGADDRRAAEN